MDTNLLKAILASFLREDIGRGDLTSESIFTPDEIGTAHLVARESFVAAGAARLAAQVFAIQNSAVVTEHAVADGTQVDSGKLLLTVTGPVIDLLKAERVALNLLQRISGIATYTALFVEKVKNYPARICDTRKTTPGLRMIEKYGVVAGGGSNHRFNLADGVLIKDNHIAACGSIAKAVAKVRDKVPHTLRLEVETDTLNQVRECLDCGVDIIMLDNMSVKQMAEAVEIIAGSVIVEASGGIGLANVEEIAKTGVDFISIGALTHSAPACDIGMDWSVSTR
ncbi:MAG: carboxylating nicotinate-nucleotide diphosphorylase [Desulfobacterales bacterium]|nr:carboxylating nicotinate-nucleotide diphosphorylase [Desulfobacterales bacterium]